MPLPQSVDLNKTALVRIVAGLFGLLGLTADAVLERIPKALHRTILRVLLPAESAARRLIVIVARSVDVKTIQVKASRPRPPRAQPAGLLRAGLGLAAPFREEPAGKETARDKPRKARLFFRLFDPRQRFFRKPRRPKNEPRPRPRITFFLGHGEFRTHSLGREPPPTPADGLETSVHLVRRLEALKAALEDLPRQALRLARAQLRREASPTLKFQSPLRPGPAPGARQRPVQEIDHVLERCHWLARAALASTVSKSPDTS